MTPASPAPYCRPSALAGCPKPTADVGGPRRAVAPRRPAGPRRLRRRPHPGAVFVDLDTELAGAAGCRRAGTRCRIRRRSCRPCCAVRACAATRRWSPTTTATAPSPRGPGGCCAGPGCPPTGSPCSTAAGRAWVADGRPTTAEPAQPARRATSSCGPEACRCSTRTPPRQLARSGVLLDARAGRRATAARPSRSTRRRATSRARATCPATEITGPDGRWLPPAELARQLRRARVRRRPSRTPVVGAYCGSGVNARPSCSPLEHAGLRPPDRPAALYPGSWSQWSADPSRPVATGAEP